MKAFIVPFSFCNFSSVERALRDIDVVPLVLTPQSAVTNNDIIVLPGVGTFGEGMAFLNQSGLLPLLKTHHISNGYFLGICLGMQLFFQASEETPGTDGLGFIPGKVRRLDRNDFKLLPHMGWNSVMVANHLKFSTINNNTFMHYLRSDYYFVHNYFCDPADHNLVCGVVQGLKRQIPVVVNSENILGVQFHPEKSGFTGTHLLRTIFSK